MIWALQNIVQAAFREYGVLAPQPAQCRCSCNQCIHGQYYGGGAVDYRCENKKRVYVHKYLASHVMQAYEPLLCIFKHLQPVVGARPLRVLCLASGPGTEAVATLLALGDAGLKNTLDVCCCDIEESWEPIALRLMSLAARECNAKCRPSFLQLDLTQRYTAESVFDIVFLPWVLSEIRDEVVREAVLDRVCQLKFRWLLVSDRTERNVVNSIVSTLAANMQVQVVKSKRKHSANHGIDFNFDPRMKREFVPQHDYETAYWIISKPGFDA